MRRLLAIMATLSLIAMFIRSAMADTYTHDTKMTIVTVQPGDTLWSIAERVDRHQDPRQTVFEIMRANGLSSAVIRPGQVLEIPVRG